MITELVTFKLPAAATREDVFEKFARTAEKWRQNPDLVRKYYLFDAMSGVAGGVYLWRTRADAIASSAAAIANASILTKCSHRSANPMTT